MRFLFYSHDGVGLGHVRRHIAIASALVAALPEAKILLATGVDEAPHLGLPPNIDILKLPGLRKVANNQYEARRLGLDMAEIRGLRSGLLKSAVESFRPGVVLVDKHPFGVGGEFRAALEAAKAAGARTALGLRDILDTPSTVLREWSEEGVRDRIADYYDRVLIYGQQSIYDPVQQYQFSPALAERTQFCGYVLNQAPCAWRNDPCAMLMPAQAVKHRLVLATTGGGEDGFELLRTFIEAANGAPWEAALVAGPMLAPEEFKELQELGRQRVKIHSFVPCLPEVFESVDALVCMGGYNTLVEAVCQGVPTVCIPRAWPRREQVLRAQAFERLGLLRSLDSATLGVEPLRREIMTALSLPRKQVAERARAALQVEGAQNAAEHLAALFASGRDRGKVVLAGP